MTEYTAPLPPDMTILGGGSTRRRPRRRRRTAGGFVQQQRREQQRRNDGSSRNNNRSPLLLRENEDEERAAEIVRAYRDAFAQLAQTLKQHEETFFEFPIERRAVQPVLAAWKELPQDEKEATIPKVAGLIARLKTARRRWAARKRAWERGLRTISSPPPAPRPSPVSASTSRRRRRGGY